MPFKVVRTLEGKKCKLRPEIMKSLLDLNSKAQKMVGNDVLRNYNTEISSSLANLLASNEFNYNEVHIKVPQANSTKTSQISLDNITPLLEDSVKFDIKKTLENQKSILDNQATILSQIFQYQQQQQESAAAIIAQIQSLNEMQNDLIQKVSALSVQLKNAVSQIISSSSQDHELTLNKSQCLIENTPIHVKPVDSVQDLDELEKQLSDANNRAHLKNKYSILCSEGINCAYLLVDVMFTRKFLLECSWSGGSRGENSKVPLKAYKHVLSFFWQMVHSRDGAYTLQDNEAFFKTILRNAKKRIMAKLERASTSRQRSKSIKNSKRIKSCQENAVLPTDIQLIEACNDFESEDEMNKEENMEQNKEKNESQGEYTEDQKSILDNQATILSQIFQNQQQQQESATAIIAQIQSLNDMQNGLIQKVSALSVQLKNVVSQIISSSSQDYVPTLKESQSLIENTPINVKPVDSVQDLDELETQLSDANNRAHLKNTLSVLCSGGKAIDCAYLLVDVMFTRNFVFECSWSGGSRGENLKIPLKGYKHVLSFFWEMVHSWDDAYTLQDNEAFFKNILKNARKRKMAKLERASTSRQRSRLNSKRVNPCQENATLPTENEAGHDYDSENETWYK